MAMKTVQIRLTEEQLKMIDKKVEQGEYPSRSEAVRDYVRRAETYELFNRLFDAVSGESFSQAELEAARERLWKQKVQTMSQSEARARLGELIAKAQKSAEESGLSEAEIAQLVSEEIAAARQEERAKQASP